LYYYPLFFMPTKIYICILDEESDFNKDKDLP
jgi:hypothetical protein